MPPASAEYAHPRAARTSHLMLLNNDVIRILLDLFDPLDALRFAMTSRLAYGLAMSRFHSEVHLGYGDSSTRSGPEQIVQFCKYMLADIPGRASHLKFLDIGPSSFTILVQVGKRDAWDRDYTCAQDLAQLLQYTDALRRLHIHDCENLVRDHPVFADAVTALPNLLDISLNQVGHSSLKAISKLTSKPGSVEFGTWNGGPLTSTDAEPFVNLKGTLETLKLRSCSCLLENVGRDYVWPRVRYLLLGGRVPRLSTLVHAFPSAHSIEFADGCVVTKDEAPTSYWETLDYVETSSPLPFFACPVRRVKLSYVLDGKDVRSGMERIEKTLVFLERASPVVFSCGVTKATSAARMEELANVMPKLKFLELVLHQHDLCSSDEALEFETWIADIIPSFRSLHLSGISLSRSGRGKDSCWSPREDSAKLAKMVIASLPTVAYVAIDGSGAGSTWYEVAGHENAHLITKLSAERGEWKQLDMQNLTRGRD